MHVSHQSFSEKLEKYRYFSSYVGTFYIGYDQKYPGVSKMVSSHVYENETPVKSKNYDMKVTLNKDLLIILKNKGNQKISKIYFSFIADSQMLILDFRVEFLGFVRD